jgi:hypothetical protein
MPFLLLPYSFPIIVFVDHGRWKQALSIQDRLNDPRYQEQEEVAMGKGFFSQEASGKSPEDQLRRLTHE